MPDWLYRLLEDVEKQHLEDAPSGISDILYKLLEQDRDVETAYLCHSAVRYVGKIKVGSKDEGGNFCCYHNIQMMISYVNAAGVEGLESLAGSVPTIWEIQGTIEKAWDQGFNESGRVQTGGIKGTRKHIGTPEVCAVHFKPMLLQGIRTVSPIYCRQRIIRSEHVIDTPTGPSTIS